MLARLKQYIATAPTEEHKKPAQQLLAIFEESQAQGKKIVVLMKQPGAKAPIKNMPEWIDAGLAGCTADICAINANAKPKPDAAVAIDIRPYLIILNSMTEAEQEAACGKSDDVKQAVECISFINDPRLSLRVALEVSQDKIKTADGRTAYLPETTIYDVKGNVLTTIEPTLNTDKSRDSKTYIDAVLNAFKAALHSTMEAEATFAPCSSPAKAGMFGETTSTASQGVGVGDATAAATAAAPFRTGLGAAGQG
jgi:hypothetical protein